MPPLTYIHASEAARTTAGGRGVGGGKITPPTACKGLRTDGAAREEPSVLELFRVATEEDRRSINENGARNTDAYITTGNGGTALSSNRYWTATERDQYNGWTFYNNGWGFMNKPYTFYVRPVLGF